MELLRSRRLVPRLVELTECRSTNDELLRRASEPSASRDWPEFSTVVTTNQTAGRGRLGREWMAPPGQSLAVSVLLRPALLDGEPLAVQEYGWLPLIAGMAMTQAVTELLGMGVRGVASSHLPRPVSSTAPWLAPASPPSPSPTVLADPPVLGSPSPESVPPSRARVSMKWPNDVLIDGLKVSGLLAELLPTGDGVVQGVGLNLSIPRENLPTPTSTSVDLHTADLHTADLTGLRPADRQSSDPRPPHGTPAQRHDASHQADDTALDLTDDLVDRALAAYLSALKAGYTGFLEHGGDPDACGIRDRLAECCSTIGQRVRVELPGGDRLIGTATGIDRQGRLCVRKPDGRVQAVAAGDVTHLRYE